MIFVEIQQQKLQIKITALIRSKKMSLETITINTVLGKMPAVLV